ncbi:MAG: AI-2E family transporter [Endomicrobia bacterium]|nr:AI-2E family transporter [Endomicrobiia bacterium]MCL2799868.1 AI-2E family transporter [Endomicrobiia bacterium]
MMTESSKNRIFIIGIILFLALCLFLYFARGILAPFIIAAFIAYLLSPVVDKIRSYGYRRWVGVAVIAVIIMAVLAAILIIFIPLILEEIDKLQVNIPAYYTYLSNHIDTVKNKIEAAFPIIKEYGVLDLAIDKIKAIAASGAEKIPGYVVNIFSIFSFLVLIPVIVLFMLLGGNRSINMIVEIVPSAHVETVLSVIYEMDSILGKFIRSQLIEASFVGVMSVIALSALNINFAILIGIFAGLANLIPYAGPILGVLVASVVALVQYQSIAVLVKVLLAFGIIKFLDDNAVQPYVVGHNVDLSPVTMMFVLLAGAQVFGFLGVVFAVPVTAIIKTIFFMLVKKYKNAF